MNKQITETIIGALILGVAAYFFFMAYNQSGKKVGVANYAIKADFSDITGISSGSDVRISGVKIGTVEAMSLNPETYQAELTMFVDKGINIPEDSSAAIIGESLLGGKFVALSVGSSETMLQNGAKIEYTQSSVSLEQLLGKFVFSGGGVDEKKDAPNQEAPSSEDDEIKLNLP